MGDRKTELQARFQELQNLELFGDGLKPEEKEEQANILEELGEMYKAELEQTLAYEKEVSQRVKRAQWRGKNAERRLAKKVGGVVVGRSKAVKLPSGKVISINCQKPPDCVTDMFSFESKSWEEIPKSIQNIMIQAQSNCPESLIPVGVIYDRAGKNAYYILGESDFLDLHC